MRHRRRIECRKEIDTAKRRKKNKYGKLNTTREEKTVCRSSSCLLFLYMCVFQFLQRNELYINQVCFFYLFFFSSILFDLTCVCFSFFSLLSLSLLLAAVINIILVKHQLMCFSCRRSACVCVCSRSEKRVSFLHSMIEKKEDE